MPRCAVIFNVSSKSALGTKYGVVIRTERLAWLIANVNT